VGGPSAWCEGNHFKVGCPGPGNEIFLAELSQSLVFLHICLSEVDGPVLTRSPGSSISPWFAKRVVTNLSDVLRRNFCLHSQRPHAFYLTAASQCCQLARVANFPTSFSIYSCVTMGQKFSVRSACCTLLRVLLEQLWIWCLGKFWSFDGLPNLMLKWIWCGSEGSYYDFYLKVVVMISTLESKVQLWPILCCVIRGLFA